MSEKVIYNSNSNRAIRGGGATWAGAHDAASGTILTNFDNPWYLLWAGSYLSGGWYYIYRTFLFHNLIEAELEGGVITEAKLSLYSYDHKPSIPRDTLHITEGVQADPVVVTNYGNQLPYTASLGSIQLSDIIDNQYNDLIFNATGLAFLNTLMGEGIVKLCIRGQRDINNYEPPSVYSNWIRPYSNQKGTVYRPKLTLIYTPAIKYKGNIHIDQLKHQHMERITQFV